VAVRAQPLERTRSTATEDACALLVPLDDSAPVAAAGEGKDDYPDDEGGI
jgi:hypothetical protein